MAVEVAVARGCRLAHDALNLIGGRCLHEAQAVLPIFCAVGQDQAAVAVLARAVRIDRVDRGLQLRQVVLGEAISHKLAGDGEHDL